MFHNIFVVKFPLIALEFVAGKPPLVSKKYILSGGLVDGLFGHLETEKLKTAVDVADTLLLLLFFLAVCLFVVYDTRGLLASCYKRTRLKLLPQNIMTE
jgi:hypothetical protein